VWTVPGGEKEKGSKKYEVGRRKQEVKSLKVATGGRNIPGFK
jgi:hypothetical protein